MLAASKPLARNTVRAPSMIWRRLALSSGAASIDCGFAGGGLRHLISSIGRNVAVTEPSVILT